MAKKNYFIKKTRVIEETITVTRKEFLKIQKNEFLAGKIARKRILKNKILTLKQINQFLRAGILKEYVYQNAVYFLESDVKEALRLETPSTLFDQASF